MSKKVIRNIGRALAYTIWVMVVFLGMMFGTSILLQLFASPDLIKWVSTPVGNLVVSALIYFVASVVALLPLRLKKKKLSDIFTELGVTKKFEPNAVVWVLFSWGTYFLVNLTVVSLISLLSIDWIDLQEKQEIGFEGLSHAYEYVLAFIALVVVAPFFEELAFRGLLFTKLRERSGFWSSTIVVSLAFAVMHLQINVGIDVFVLSIFLCFLRERFQSLWPSVMLHALKNGIAYTLLFILPLYGISLV